MPVAYALPKTVSGEVDKGIQLIQINRKLIYNFVGNK